jgi:hypothetical protein
MSAIFMVLICSTLLTLSEALVRASPKAALHIEVNSCQEMGFPGSCSSSVPSNLDRVAHENEIRPSLHIWMESFSEGKLIANSSDPCWSCDSQTKKSVSENLFRKTNAIIPQRDESFEESFKVPVLGAWRVAVSNADLNAPPSLLDFLSDTALLQQHHVDNVAECWNNIKNRASMKHFNEDEKARVIKALKVAYVALYGKRTLRSLEISMNRQLIGVIHKA